MKKYLQLIMTNPVQTKAILIHLLGMLATGITFLGVLGVSPDTIAQLQSVVAMLTGNAEQIAIAAGAVLGAGTLVWKIIQTTFNNQSKNVEKIPGIEVNVTDTKVAPPSLVKAAESGDRLSIVIDRPASMVIDK